MLLPKSCCASDSPGNNVFDFYGLSYVLPSWTTDPTVGTIDSHVSETV